MKIYLRSHNAFGLQIEIDPSSCVLQLRKALIQLQISDNHEDIRFISMGRILNENNTFEGEGISQKSVIHVRKVSQYRQKFIKVNIYWAQSNQNGETFQIEVDVEGAVSIVKESINKATGIPIKNQQLFFEGVKLEPDNMLISSFYIIQESTITLITKSTSQRSPRRSKQILTAFAFQQDAGYASEGSQRSERKDRAINEYIQCQHEVMTPVYGDFRANLKDKGHKNILLRFLGEDAIPSPLPSEASSSPVIYHFQKPVIDYRGNRVNLLQQFNPLVQQNEEIQEIEVETTLQLGKLGDLLQIIETQSIEGSLMSKGSKFQGSMRKFMDQVQMSSQMQEK